MPILKIPSGSQSLVAPFKESRVPSSDEFIVLSKPLLDATVAVANFLRDCKEKWAFSGDLAEFFYGVSVRPEQLSVLTTTEGCDEVAQKLYANMVHAPAIVEKKIDREALVDSSPRTVYLKSRSAQFDINGARLTVCGDLQIRVGDWEWGDPLDFEPDHVYIGSDRVPVTPLSLKLELYIGLGWVDRVKKIKEAMARRHHGFG